MPLATLRQVLDEAAKGGYGVGAFNVNNMEQVQGIVDAAVETSSPVIMQASRGAIAYAGPNYLRHLILAAVETAPEIPIVLHLDHGDKPETCFMAIELGFTSVMMDGSLLADGKTPSDYEYNVAVTREVVEAAHAKGVSVEGELGTLGGIEDGHGSGEVHLTDPDQAVDFVEQTGVDALAVAIGTSHGAYKFTAKPTGDVLAMHLIEEIHTKLPETHMVMHGSSSVPQELVDRINAAGGKLEATYGVPVEEIQQGIRHGVRKVNVDTDGRLAITAALRESREREPVRVRPARLLQAGARRDEGGRRPADERLRLGRPRRRLHRPLARGDGEELRGEPRRCLSTDLDQLASTRSAPSTVDAVQAAQSGHPGAPLALAPAAYLLYTRIMKHNPADPHWPDRDRFVLSAGHASMLLYASLHLSGYDLIARRDQAVPPARLADAGPSRERRHAGRRDDHRPARPGVRERRRDGDGREVPAREVRRRGLRPPHLRDLLRRRPDGGRRLRGGLARRAPAARPARLPLRRQQDHDRRPDRPRVLAPRTSAEALRGLRLAHAHGRGRQRPRRDRGARSAPGSPRRSARR